MFVLTLRLQKTSSRRLGQDQYIRLGYTSSRRFQDVLEDVKLLRWRRVEDQQMFAGIKRKKEFIKF